MLRLKISENSMITLRNEQANEQIMKITSELSNNKIEAA